MTSEPSTPRSRPTKYCEPRDPRVTRKRLVACQNATWPEAHKGHGGVRLDPVVGYCNGREGCPPLQIHGASISKSTNSGHCEAVFDGLYVTHRP
jgi:hypothetical protein